jgi:hypothetical protein
MFLTGTGGDAFFPQIPGVLGPYNTGYGAGRLRLSVSLS